MLRFGSCLVLMLVSVQLWAQPVQMEFVRGANIETLERTNVYSHLLIDDNILFVISRSYDVHAFYSSQCLQRVHLNDITINSDHFYGDYPTFSTNCVWRRSEKDLIVTPPDALYIDGYITQIGDVIYLPAESNQSYTFNLKGAPLGLIDNFDEIEDEHSKELPSPPPITIAGRDATFPLLLFNDIYFDYIQMGDYMLLLDNLKTSGKKAFTIVHQDDLAELGNDAQHNTIFLEDENMDIAIQNERSLFIGCHYFVINENGQLEEFPVEFVDSKLVDDAMKNSWFKILDNRLYIEESFPYESFSDYFSNLFSGIGVYQITNLPQVSGVGDAVWEVY